MRKLYIVILFYTIGLSFSDAQTANNCGFDLVVESLKNKNPNFETEWMQWQQEVLQQHKRSQTYREIIADTLYFEIPVVFHVVYNTPAQNIPDQYITSQIEVLNESFRKQLSDTSFIRPIFKDLAADVKIQFKLATVDPLGNPTTGIVRKSTTVTNWDVTTFSNLSLIDRVKSSATGGADGWNPKKYLNIWVCNMTNSITGFVQTLGYAYPPTNAPNWSSSTMPIDAIESGIVLSHTIVGVNNIFASADYKNGKTAVHEVGHYLGLRHIWGDGNCNFDDGIEDTPLAGNRSTTTACGSSKNTCGLGTPGDLPDNYENFMDYTLTYCAAMFTKQQAAIMLYVLNELRAELPFRYIEYDTIPDSKSNTVKQIDFISNPIQSSVQIMFTAKDSAVNSYLCLYDITGKKAKSILLQNGNNAYPISDIRPGVYLWRLETDAQKHTEKGKIIVY